MSQPLLFEELDEYFHFLEIFKSHLGRLVSTLASVFNLRPAHRRHSVRRQRKPNGQ